MNVEWSPKLRGTVLPRRGGARVAPVPELSASALGRRGDRIRKRILLSHDDPWNPKDPQPMGTLDDITASELIRDMEEVVR